MTKGNGGANEHMCVCLQDQSAQIKKNQDQDRPALWSPSLFYGHVVAVPTVHLHAE